MPTTNIVWNWGTNTDINFNPATDILDFGWFAADQFTISEVNGTVVLHGDGVAGSGHKDFGLQGTNRVATHPCAAGSPGPAPGCGYPLAILAYNPNEAAPTTSTGQTLLIDISNSNSQISGIVYTGGTADFNPVTVDGSLIGWDVNISNLNDRITYNPTYGNAAPPPAFTSPIAGSGGGIAQYPATWVHCTNYTDGTGADDFNGPTPCQ